MLKFGKGHCLPGVKIFKLGAAAALFNPATQFSGGLLGLWYDPSDYTTLYQDSIGATPVTAVTQPVGLMLDKRLGLVRGSEYITNAADRDFSSDTGYWTKDASATISGGVLNVNTATSTYPIYRFNQLSVGLWEITYTLTVASGSVSAFLNNTGITRTLSGTYTDRLYVTGVATIGFLTPGPFVGTIDNLSIKQITGNHIAQATSANRPITGTQGSAQYETFNGTNSGLATGAMTFSADMDCFIAVRRATAASVLLFTSAPLSGSYFGIAESGSAASADANSGTPTYAVNGVALNGGAVGVTRDQVHTALTVGGWAVLEVRNLNLLTSWPSLSVGNYGSPYNLNGDIGGIILAPAGDATARQKNRQYLGNKVGLSL